MIWRPSRWSTCRTLGLLDLSADVEGHVRQSKEKTKLKTKLISAWNNVRYGDLANRSESHKGRHSRLHEGQIIFPHVPDVGRIRIGLRIEEDNTNEEDTESATQKTDCVTGEGERKEEEEDSLSKITQLKRETAVTLGEEAKVHKHLVAEMWQKQNQGLKQVLESESNKLQFELQTPVQDNGEFENNMKKAEIQLQELQELQFKETKKRCIKLAETVTKMQLELDKMSGLLSEAEKKSVKPSMDCSVLESQLQDVQEVLQEETRQKRFLTTRLRQLNAEQNRLKEQLEREKEARGNLEKQLCTMQEQIPTEKMDVKERLLETLDDLDIGKRKRFKWFLKGYGQVSASLLEDTDNTDIVDEMVKSFGPDRALKLTAEILRKMKQNHLAEQLENNWKKGVAL